MKAVKHFFIRMTIIFLIINTLLMLSYMEIVLKWAVGIDFYIMLGFSLLVMVISIITCIILYRIRND